MPIILMVTLDGGGEYKHTLSSAQCSLAQLLTDLYIGLAKANHPVLDLHPAYVAYSTSNNKKYTAIHREQLGESLPSLISKSLPSKRLDQTPDSKLMTYVKSMKSLFSPPAKEDTYFFILTGKRSLILPKDQGSCNLSVTTLLHIVTHPKTKNRELAKKLLDNILKDGKDACGNTALHLDARRGDDPPEEIKCRNINEQNVTTETIGVARYQYPADEGRRNTALHLAAFHGHWKWVSALIKAGAEIDIINEKSADDGKTYGPADTPLHLSVENGHIEATKILLEAKANVNAQGLNKFSPLHYALSSQYNFKLDMVDLLLENNADVNSTDYQNQTPLYALCLYFKNGFSRDAALETIQKLIDHHADVTVIDDVSGDTVLHFLAGKVHSVKTVGYYFDMFKYLINSGVNPNLKNRDGHTVLYDYSMKPELVKFLITHGADPSLGIYGENSDDQNFQEYQNLYLKSYLGPIVKEVSEKLIFDEVLTNLKSLLPNVLVPIIQGYLEGQNEILIKDRETALILARQQALDMFDEHVRKVEKSSQIEYLRKKLSESTLLSKEAVKIFLDTQVKVEGVKDSVQGEKISLEEKKKKTSSIEHGAFFQSSIKGVEPAPLTSDLSSESRDEHSDSAERALGLPSPDRS